MTALRITEVAVTGFRNLRTVRAFPDPRANVLVGANGQGKTSLLEAVDYAATLRSFRGATRAQLVGHEAPEAQLLVRVESAISGHEYRIKLSRTARDITLDGKRPERAIEYFGNAACVVFQPGDLDLIRGAPETRRRLLDRMLMRTVEGYGEALKNYGKALRARNQLLRERSPNLNAIAAFDLPLARYGSGIIRARERVVSELLGAARQALDEVALTDDAITLAYRPRGSGDTLAFSAALAEAHRVDLARKTTTLGPHGDDLLIAWGGRAARNVASQGQTRALALALRLAELHILEARTRTVPVLLLDDVSSELDRTRTERLFALVGRLGAQVWVTTTDPAIAALVPHARVFAVDAGQLSVAVK
ncbi:MAG: DNA replication and repair protein RecF [Myxococcales bacterium]|nr:DNA replication and repair protein RecF [Myxococcales bacterium]